MRECAEKMNLKFHLHTSIPVMNSQYAGGHQGIISRYTVAVMTSKEVAYINDPRLNMLRFSLSALQQWLLYLELLADDASRSLPTELFNVMKFEMMKEIVPFSLINHLLSKLRLVRCCNELTPIVICDNWTCKLL